MQPTVQRLLGVGALTLEESRPRDYAMLAQIDFGHPLFAPFADPRYSDFTRIHFWKYRWISTNGLAGARVLARFDNSAPALLEVPVGKGRVLVLASGWHPEDSQFALSTKFVPFIYSLMEEAGAPPAPPVQYLIGDAVPLPTAANELVRPGGNRIHFQGSNTNYVGTDVPGVYHISEPGRDSGFAVNVDPMESRLEPISLDELERMGVPMSASSLAREEQTRRTLLLRNAEVEARQKFWRWTIGLALVVLLVETYLAGRAARQTSPAGGVA
jgi:hypothetical protein